MNWIALFFLLLGGGNSLLDHVDARAFWAAEEIDPTPQNLRALLSPPAQPDPEEIAALIRQLGAESFAEREQATQRLAAIGPVAAPALEAARSDRDPEIAFRAREILGRFAPASQSTRVRLLLAVRTLGELRDEASIPALESLLPTADPMLRLEITDALGKIRSGALPRSTSPDPLKSLRYLPSDAGVVVLFRLFPFPPGGTSARLPILHPFMVTAINTHGNARVDHITYAHSRDMMPGKSWAFALVEGQYDSAVFAEGLVRHNGAVKVSEDGLVFYQIPRVGLYLFPLDDTRLALLYSHRGPVANLTLLIARLRQPAEKPNLSDDLAALMAELPPEATLRLCMTDFSSFPIPLEELPLLKSFRMAGVREEKGFHITGVGRSPEPDTLATLVVRRNMELQQLRQMLGQFGGEEQKPFLGILDTLRLEPTKDGLKLELTLPLDVYKILTPVLPRPSEGGEFIEDMTMPEFIE